MHPHPHLQPVNEIEVGHEDQTKQRNNQYLCAEHITMIPHNFTRWEFHMPKSSLFGISLGQKKTMKRSDATFSTFFKAIL